MANKKAPRLDFSKMACYGLQEEIKNDQAKYKIVAFGRQSGKSWLAKRISLEESANNGKRILWVAPSIPTALDHWNDLVELIEESGIPTRNINSQQKIIRFHSGGSIRIRPAEKPNNLRGGTIDLLILDEAAFMHQDVWYKILQPTITASRGKVLFLSTPNGQNWFYRLFALGQNDEFTEFRSWHMPSTKAPYQDKEGLELIRRTVPELVWREEYMAEFLADSGGVFAGLDKVKYRAMIHVPKPGHVYVAGIDWGMDNDYTVFTVGDKYTGQQVFAERFTSIGTIDQVNRIIKLLEIWKPEICHIELNGIGVPMYKLLKEMIADEVDDRDNQAEYLGLNSKIKIRGVHMNNIRKRKAVESLSAAIEYGRFQPLVRENEMDMDSYGAIQMQEMSTYQRKRTATELEVTYNAAEGYHDDTVSATYLLYLGMQEADASKLTGPSDRRPTGQKHKKVSAQNTRKTKKRSPFNRHRTGNNGTGNVRRDKE